MEEFGGFIAHIRFKSSVECSQSRNEKRSSYLNIRRKDFVNCDKKHQVPSLEHFTKSCSFFKKEKKIKDLEPICIGLANGPQYRKTFLQMEGLLYALIGCVSGCTGNLQIKAVICIINLGLGTKEECMKVCEKAGPYLIIFLSGENPYMQGHCFWALGNLCGSYPETCNLLHAQGFEELANRVLCSTSSPQVFQWGCYALNLYLNTVPERIRHVCNPDLVKVLIRHLHWGSECIRETSWCLFTLSTDPDTCSLLVKYGASSAIINTLVDAVQEENLETSIATALVRILTNCIAVVNNVSIEICYKTSDFVPVVENLLDSPFEHLRKETLQLVANVVVAANSLSTTGESVLEDSNLRQKLDGCVKRALASNFVLKPPTYSFATPINEFESSFNFL